MLERDILVHELEVDGSSSQHSLCMGGIRKVQVAVMLRRLLSIFMPLALEGEKDPKGSG